MRNLFILAYKYRTFLLFIGLEILSFIFIVSFNPYHNSSFFYSSSNFSGALSSSVASVSDFFNLSEQNQQLNELNAKLLSKIESKQKIADEYEQLKNVYDRLEKNIRIDTSVDSSLTPLYHYINDTSTSSQYVFIPSKVIRNDIRYDENYITLNKGEKDGIAKGMGVVGPNGVAGMIVNVSKNYSIAKSVLHISHRVASAIKKNEIQGSLKWDGRTIGYANLEFVPKHVTIEKGDSIVTSGFNLIFPEKTLVGTISDYTIDKHNTYYEITVKLVTDFKSLKHVYIVSLKDKSEILKLQAEVR